MNRSKLILLIIFFVSTVTTVYSFSLTDLNLTLSQNPLILSFQQSLQNLGFYHRNVSTVVFVLIFISWTIIYIFLNSRNNLTDINKKSLIFVLVFPLTFSYSAFLSYDIFNYIFDSKIISQYGKNPYNFSALDFPNDPMVHFMRWTHRTYPYGPLWLIPGIIITLISTKLLVQIFMFKIVAILSAIYASNLLNLKSDNKNFLFLFNPLIITEVLIGNHNDIFVALTLIISVIYVTNTKISYLSLIIGGLIKYANFFMIPALIIKKFNAKYFLNSLICLTLLSIIIASIRTEFQVWYIIWILPLAYISPKGSIIRNYVILISLLLPFSYIPYIQSGSYEGLSFSLKYIIVVISVLLSFILYKWHRKLL